MIVILTIPITLVTLGLFLLVINAAMLGLVAALLEDFALRGFGSALLMPEHHVHQAPVVAENGVAHVDGRSYRWTGKPWKHDPMKNWLKGVSL